jgi:hypothetical protein
LRRRPRPKLGCGAKERRRRRRLRTVEITNSMATEREVTAQVTPNPSTGKVHEPVTSSFQDPS